MRVLGYTPRFERTREGVNSKMNLNPVVVIPTYWTSRRSSLADAAVYDHMTPIDKPGELPRCLKSLQKVAGVGRVVLLVVAGAGVETQAADKVRAIAANFPQLNTTVIGEAELRYVHRRMEQLGMGAFAPAASLSGYGAVRNLGLLVASIYGHDTVVFVDDDEVVATEDFLARAVHGIAMTTPDGSIVTAKTGFFLNEANDYKAPEKSAWYDFMWNKNKDFNAYIERVVAGPRLSVAQTACGGCMTLHADAYGSVAFDPWITRGEDLDYLLNLRMHGVSMWFDNQFFLRHMPPDVADTPTRFEQDVYRWFYENRKIEFAKTQIDLMQVDPSSLSPYPGPWLSSKIGTRVRVTALLRAIGKKERGAYWRIGSASRKKAGEYARENCANYFEFQHNWPQIVRSMWDYRPLASQLSTMHSISATSGFTGRFSAIGSDALGTVGAGATRTDARTSANADSAS